MTTEPLVSVIMPVYNSGLYVAEAIESVLNQTFKDFEFLIFNDGSTDNSLEIISSYQDERLKVIDANSNTGYVPHLNHGIEIARGKYIARMDSDDICLLHRLELQFQFMECNPKVGVCGSWVQTFGGQNAKVWKYEADHNSLLAQMFFNSPMAHPSVMIRKSVLHENSLLYDSSFVPAEDYLMWFRMSKLCKLANIQEILLEYRIHAGQIGNEKNNLQIENANKVRLGILKANGFDSGIENVKFLRQLSGDEGIGSRKDFLNLGSWVGQFVSRLESTGSMDDLYLKKIIARYWMYRFEEYRVKLDLRVTHYFSMPYIHFYFRLGTIKLLLQTLVK